MFNFSVPKRKIRAAIRWLWIVFVWCSGLLWWAKWRLAVGGGVIVLAFHRVFPEKEFSETLSTPGMLLREKTFDQVARSLSTRYETVDPTGITFNRTDGRRNPRVAFTFDDGWSDTADVALPITRKYGIPVTIFICPERLDTALPFWPERVVGIWRQAEKSPSIQTRLLELLRHLGAHFPSTLWTQGILAAAVVVSFLKTLPNGDLVRTICEMEKIGGRSLLHDRTTLGVDSTMTWEQVKSLSKEGVHFGSHTQTHPILSRVSLDEVHTELVDSKQAIESHLQRECTLFAYPNGSWTDAVRNEVAQAGYKLAFIVEPGWWTPDTDHHLVPRVCLCEEQLSGAKGAFFELALDYMVFWRSYRARRLSLLTTAKRTQPSAAVSSSSSVGAG